MIAFHGKQEVKDFYLARAKAHFAADEIVHGQYWEDGKGCAVGCLIHSNSHSQLAKEINIPIEMAFLIDGLFEGMSNGTAKSFPVRFIESIPVGAELDCVIDRYLLALLSDNDHGVIISANNRTRKPIQDVIDLFARQVSGHGVPTVDEWTAAAYSAAYSVADSVADSAAYSAADMAAYSVAYSAAYCAACRAACRAAAGSAAGSAAYSAAVSNHFVWQSETLLNLLSTAPVLVLA